MIGIWSIGAVCIPINTMLRENELRYIVQQSDAQWLFMEQKAGGVMHTDSISNMYEQIKADGNEGEMKRIICIQNTGEPMDERFVHWDTFFKEKDKTSEQQLEKAMEEADSPDQIANIMYTSGSTGTPKGVIITTETGAVFVELRPGSEYSRKALLHYCKAHIARFKVPRYIWFITDSELPIGGNGKVQKMTLAENAENELARKRESK